MHIKIQERFFPNVPPQRALPKSREQKGKKNLSCWKFVQFKNFCFFGDHSLWLKMTTLHYTCYCARDYIILELQDVHVFHISIVPLPVKIIKWKVLRWAILRMKHFSLLTLNDWINLVYEMTLIFSRFATWHDLL